MKQHELFNFDQTVNKAYENSNAKEAGMSDWNRMRMALDQQGLLKKSNFRLVWFLYFNMALLLSALVIYATYTGFNKINEPSVLSKIEVQQLDNSSSPIELNKSKITLKQLSESEQLTESKSFAESKPFSESINTPTKIKDKVSVRNKNSNSKSIPLIIPTSENIPTESTSYEENAVALNTELSSAQLIAYNTFENQELMFPNSIYSEKSLAEFGIKEYPKREPYWAYRMYIGLQGNADLVNYKLKSNNSDGAQLIQNFEEKLNGNQNKMGYSFGMQIGYQLNSLSALEINILYAQKRSIETGPGYISNSSDTSSNYQKYQYHLQAKYFEGQVFYKRYLNSNALRVYVSPGIGVNMNAGKTSNNYFVYESKDAEKNVRNKILLNQSSLGVDLIAKIGMQYALSSRTTLGIEAGQQWGFTELVRKDNYTNIPISHYLRDFRLGLNLNYHFIKR